MIDPVLAEQQRAVESGADLGPGGQRVLFKARSRQDQQDFTGAAALVREWLDGRPANDHHLLRFNLALSYFGLEDTEKALENLRLAVKAEPRFGRAWLRLGEAAYGQELYAEAAAAFGRGYELSPQSYPEVLYYSGAAWLLADQPVKACTILDQVLRENQSTAPLDWYQALVAAAVAAEKPSLAAHWLDQLLDERTADPGAWELAYRFAAGEQDYRQAAIYLAVTGYLRELGREELFQLGDLYSAIGVPLQAARYYQRALALPAGPEEPQRDDRLERLASAWVAAHEYDQALAAFRGFTEKVPDSGRSWLMMGYCALELDRPDEARRYLEKAAGFPDQAANARDLMSRL